jgi:hypothetical protein
MVFSTLRLGIITGKVKKISRSQISYISRDLGCSMAKGASHGLDRIAWKAPRDHEVKPINKSYSRKRGEERPARRETRCSNSH